MLQFRVVEEFFPKNATAKKNMLVDWIGGLVMDGDNRTIQRQRTRKIHALKNQSLLIPVPKYSTLFYFGGEYLFNENIVLGSIATYGGYSKFQLGSYFRWRSSSAIIAISTNNILAFVSKNSSGMGVNLSLSYLMK